MKTWVTEIIAINPNDSERGLVNWCGPEIKALTHRQAEEYCQNNGLGYCRVIGELIIEIPCKDGTLEPNFEKSIDYEQSQLN